VDGHERNSASVAHRSGPRRVFRPAPTAALLAVLAALCGAGFLYLRHARSAAAQSVFADLPELNTRLEFPDGTHFDLGELKEKSPFEHKFRVRNLGPAPFNSLDFKWSCGSCSKTDVSLETDPLPPGEESFIRVSSQVAPVHRGRHRREFPVVNKSAERLTFTLAVSYSVRWEPRVELLHSRVEFLPMWQQAEPQTRYNEIHLDGPPIRGPYHVHSIESDTPGVTCAAKQTDVDTPHRAPAGVSIAPLEVRVDPKLLPLGPFTATVTARTDCGSAQMHVTGKVTDGVALVPESVLLPGNREGAAQAHFFVRNVADQDLVVQEATSSTKHVNVRISGAFVVRAGAQVMMKVAVDDVSALPPNAEVMVSYRLGDQLGQKTVAILVL
jgi:hypothetical protein